MIDSELKFELKDRVLVCDFDDVLVPFSEKMVHRMFNHKHEFKGEIEFNINNNTPEAINARDTYDVVEWLAKDKKNMAPDLKKRVLALIDEPNFYDRLPPTKFALDLAYQSKNPNYHLILYIISNCLDSHIEAKRKYIKELFKDTKSTIEFIPIPLMMKKSEIINNNKIDYNMFIDDKGENIIDVVTNTNSYGREFAMPVKGYNQTDHFIKLYDKLIEKRCISVLFIKEKEIKNEIYL